MKGGVVYKGGAPRPTSGSAPVIAHARRRSRLRRPAVPRPARHHRDRHPARSRGCGAHRSRAVDDARHAAGGAGAARASRVGDVRQLLLTHIHLDHAGRHRHARAGEPGHRSARPRARRAAHGRSVKLMASATRLYGEATWQRLWGEFLPVPAREPARAAGRRDDHRRRAASWRSPTRPGHAVASRQLLRSREPRRVRRRHRRASAGATATYVMPPTPPPDIDLEAWRESEARILAWDPDTLFLTHFGPFHGARLQFQELRENIEAWSRIVRRLLADPVLTEAAAAGRVRRSRRSATCAGRSESRRRSSTAAPGVSTTPGRGWRDIGGSARPDGERRRQLQTPELPMQIVRIPAEAAQDRSVWKLGVGSWELD